MEQYPLVSIVTPCYNSVEFIERTIRSVLDQDYPRLEYIVMDGGSADGTVAILEQYRDRLTFVSARDGGAADAINRGFARASGSIFAWLNADDKYVAGAVSAAVSALASAPEPKFLRDRTDLPGWADRLAWGEIDDEERRIGSGHGARLFTALAAGRRPVDSVSQVVHGGLYGRVLFAGTAPPAVVSIAPFWRPAAWAAGVIAVDALARGGAPIELLTEWDRWPHWPELLRRALLFRLAASLAHPRTPPSDIVTMLSTAERIAPYLD